MYVEVHANIKLIFDSDLVLPGINLKLDSPIWCAFK